MGACWSNIAVAYGDDKNGTTARAATEVRSTATVQLQPEECFPANSRSSNQKGDHVAQQVHNTLKPTTTSMGGAVASNDAVEAAFPIAPLQPGESSSANNCSSDRKDDGCFAQEVQNNLKATSVEVEATYNDAVEVLPIVQRQPKESSSTNNSSSNKEDEGVSQEVHNNIKPNSLGGAAAANDKVKAAFPILDLPNAILVHHVLAWLEPDGVLRLFNEVHEVADAHRLDQFFCPKDGEKLRVLAVTSLQKADDNNGKDDDNKNYDDGDVDDDGLDSRESALACSTAKEKICVACARGACKHRLWFQCDHCASVHFAEGFEIMNDDDDDDDGYFFYREDELDKIACKCETCKKWFCEDDECFHEYSEIHFREYGL